MMVLYMFYFMFLVIFCFFWKLVKYGIDDDNSNLWYVFKVILVNGVMKVVGSGKICKIKVEEIW